MEKLIDIVLSYKTDLIMIVIVGTIYAGYKIFAAIRKGKNKDDNSQNT